MVTWENLCHSVENLSLLVLQHFCKKQTMLLMHESELLENHLLTKVVVVDASETRVKMFGSYSFIYFNTTSSALQHYISVK